jgi:hypothetical protein
VTSPAPPAPVTTEGPASFTATYELTLAEQVRAMRRVAHRRPSTWFAYATLVLILPAGDVLIKLVLHGRWQPDELTMMLGAVFALFAVVLYAEPWMTARRQRKQMPHGPVTLTVEEAGITIASDMGSHSCAWKVVKDVRRDDAFAYLHLSKSFAFVIPFRAVSTQQLDAFWWVVGRWAPHLVRHSRAA